ncbi:MAG: leucine-rich repeat domain-containing protein, partial [Christensenellaceae bacterium]|nr:leucine-rich repeat domain-containing protein [Christensenellaceae bacterium]
RIGDNAFNELPICSALIADTVTSIGKYAFANNYGENEKSTLVIPDSVTEIGEGAFACCFQFNKIVLPVGLERIENRTFTECYGLREIVIPDSVTTIGNSAFSYCENLTSITIPSFVTNIGDGAFDSFAYEGATIIFEGDAPAFGNDVFSNVTATAYYPANNDTWAEIAVNNEGFGGNVTWVAVVEEEEPEAPEDNTDIASGTCGENLTWVLSEDGTLTISGSGYMTDYSDASPAPWKEYKADIKRLVIKEGVDSVGDYAFKGLSVLAEITLPGMAQMGWCAFDQCTNIEEVTFEGTIEYYEGGTFQGCDNIKKVHIGSIEEWLDNAIGYSEPGDVPTYGSGELYLDGELVTEVVLPEGRSFLGMYAFYGCSSIKSITLNSDLKGIDESAFAYSGLTEINIPESVGYITSYAFEYCEDLKKVSIPNGELKYIYGAAFANCTALEEIIFEGDAPTTIANNVFVNVTANVYYPCGNDTWTEEKKAQYGGELTWTTEHTYDEGVVTTEPSPFWTGVKTFTCAGCGETYTEELPKTESDGGECGENAEWLLTGDGTLTISGTGEMAFEGDAPWSKYNQYIISANIGDGITSIAFGAFYSLSYLKDVVIGEDVNTIGKSAFRGCSSLATVDIPEKTTTIGEYAFCQASGLKSVTGGEGITTIEDRAFYDCRALESFAFSDKLTTVGPYAFYCCSSLENLDLPETLTSIGQNSFYGLHNLPGKVTIPVNIKDIPQGAFGRMVEIDELVLPEGIETIDKEA